MQIESTIPHAKQSLAKMEENRLPDIDRIHNPNEISVYVFIVIQILSAILKSEVIFMSLKLDLCGIQLDFEIRNYKPSAADNRFTEWCLVDFHVCSGKWLDYHIDGELLMCDEVDEIIAHIDNLLNDGVGELHTCECIEPDFRFAFSPQKDRTKDPRYTYVAPGYEIEDIKLEWSVYFWDGGLTENRLTLVFVREDIVALQRYLRSVID